MTQSGSNWQEIAAANLLEARKRNGRIGSRKSRGGCITCKTRRLKCDENKPSCIRCTNSGRQCGGYGESTTVANRGNSGQPSISLPIARILGLRNQDRRTYDFFLSGTAPRIAGPLDKEFWGGYVLQLAQAEPFVLDSLLAISTLYEHPQYLVSLRGHHLIDPETPPAQIEGALTKSHLDDHHATALRHYNRAIALFKNKVEGGQTSPLLAVLSCALFICIEIIRDNVFVALDLFVRGTKLMNQFSDTAFSGDEQKLMYTIRLMFSRLGILASAFGHAPLDLPPECIIAGHHKFFKTMADARTELFAFMADSHAFVRDATFYKGTLMGDADTTPGDGIFGERFSRLRKEMLEAESARSDINGNPSSATPVISPSDIPESPTFGFSPDTIPLNSSSPHPSQHHSFSTLQARQNQLAQRLQDWHTAFQVLLTTPNRPLSEDETEVISSLLMYYHESHIWLSVQLSPTQHAFDAHEAHFRSILHHAERYIQSKQEKILSTSNHTPPPRFAPAATQPHFTFEMGAVLPLYFVATKCRIPSVRRAALRSLGQTPTKKECMWGATSTGQLAERIILIEEEGLGLPSPEWRGQVGGKEAMSGLVVDDSNMPAEEQRVHTLEIQRDALDQRFEVRVTRYRRVEGGDGRVVKAVQDFAV